MYKWGQLDEYLGKLFLTGSRKNGNAGYEFVDNSKLRVTHKLHSHYGYGEKHQKKFL